MFKKITAEEANIKNKNHDANLRIKLFCIYPFRLLYFSMKSTGPTEI